ncbi:MAG: hypothetical protein AAGG72_06950, partial [Pseudomonadota bacterium]
MTEPNATTKTRLSDRSTVSSGIAAALLWLALPSGAVLAADTITGIGATSRPMLQSPFSRSLDAESDPVRTEFIRVAQRTIPARQSTPDAGAEPERRYKADMDKALKPVVSMRLSKTDKDRLKSAFKALRKSDLLAALALRDETSSPVARKLIDWERLRRGLGDRAEMSAFLSENPLWPNHWKIERQIETRLFETQDHRASLAYFANRQPKSALGSAALASAYQNTGKTAAATQLVRQAWRQMDFDSETESAFLDRHGKQLRTSDHKWRLDRLLTTDFRWKGSRRKHATIVRRQMKRVPAIERRIA